MKNITLDLRGSFIDEDELKKIKPEIMAAQETLLDRKGVSSEMTGWLDYMYRIDKMNTKKLKLQQNILKKTLKLSYFWE